MMFVTYAVLLIGDTAGQRQLSRKPAAVSTRHSDIRADANPAASGPAVDTHRSIQRRQASLPTLQALCIGAAAKLTMA